MKTLKLINPHFNLDLLPERGCHWTFLKIPLEGAWRDIIVPVADISMAGDLSLHAGSYLMAPWCNRVRGAEFSYRGTQHTLRPNFFDGSAIHGDVRTRAWSVTIHRSDYFQAVLETRAVADFNFPFPLKFIFTIQLQNETLHADLRVKNLTHEPVPVGFGFHPFFKRRLTPDDVDVELVLPANRVYPIEKGIPLDASMAVAGRTDRRSARPLGAPDFDDCFTDMSTHPIEIIYRGSKRKIEIRLDPVFGHCFLFAPNEKQDLPEPFVAVEPMTMVTAGLNLLTEGWMNTGVKILQPEEEWGGAMRLEVSSLT